MLYRTMLHFHPEMALDLQNIAVDGIKVLKMIP